MKIKMKSEKGYTGIDIAIAIVLLFIFVSIIAILLYNINSSAKGIQLKSEATALAVELIEEMKSKSFDEIKNRSITNNNSQYIPEDTTKDVEEIEGNEGFFRRVMIEDYTDSHPDKIPGLVKKIIVQVKYTFKGEEKTVELTTTRSKEVN